MEKINEYREVLYLDQIDIYDLYEQFEKQSSSGYFNRHEFSQTLLKLLISKKVIDPYSYNKCVNDNINKLFSILDKTKHQNGKGTSDSAQNGIGIVDIEEVIGLTLLWRASVGDRIRVLFKVYADEQGKVSFHDFSRFFRVCFILTLDNRTDLGFTVDLQKLAHETTKNLIKSTRDNIEGKIEDEKVTIDQFRKWTQQYNIKKFYLDEVDEE